MPDAAQLVRLASASLVSYLSQHSVMVVSAVTLMQKKRSALLVECTLHAAFNHALKTLTECYGYGSNTLLSSNGRPNFVPLRPSFSFPHVRPSLCVFIVEVQALSSCFVAASMHDPAQQNHALIRCDNLTRQSMHLP